MLREFAPAKINLYLHITGRRPDGYHALDSLVAFAGVGDDIILEPAAHFEFILEGPQATALQSEDNESNFAVRAARLLAEKTGKDLNVRLTLIKNLPVASGIGGGSSDAAALLRALALHWGLSAHNPRLMDVAVTFGDDVAACLKIENRYITASGAVAGPALPHADILLINPGKALATAEVYKNFKNRNLTFSAAAPLDDTAHDLPGLIAALKDRHNDLAGPAMHLLPEIKNVLTALENSAGCLLARMSGSGATCFGIFADRDSARKAAALILNQHRDWWLAQSYIPCRCDRRSLT